jgi:hypothetical protein
MLRTTLRLAVLSALYSTSALLADEALLAVPGKVLVDDALSAAPGESWKLAKGKWVPVEGVLKGDELPEDKHGAVMRYNTKLTDFIVQVDVKLDGARTTTLSINAEKDHMCRVSITPTMVTVQRDDNDHDGPDKAVVFHRVKADITPGQWHTVRIEMVGDTMLGKVDHIIGWGSSELFTKTKAAPGMTVGGQSMHFRNFKIWEATKNPAWDTVSAKLKNEIAEAPAKGKGKSPKGKGKGKGKAKAE